MLYIVLYTTYSVSYTPLLSHIPSIISLIPPRIIYILLYLGFSQNVPACNNPTCSPPYKPISPPFLISGSTLELTGIAKISPPQSSC